jgi:hypothetical protein
MDRWAVGREMSAAAVVVMMVVMVVMMVVMMLVAAAVKEMLWSWLLEPPRHEWVRFRPRPKLAVGQRLRVSWCTCWWTSRAKEGWFQ